MNRPTSTPPLRGPLLRQPATWRAEVFAVAFGCAVLATVVDTYLLDRKLGLFSGGYLAEYQVRGWSRVSFAALSLLTDVAVLAPVIAASLWVSRYLWLHAAARIFLAASLALALLATADIAVYELQRYFGDLVNLEVLVGLLDGDIREILHFGVDPALHWFGVLTVGALCVVGAGVVLDRWFPTQMRQDPGARRRTFRALVLALAAALVLGAGLRLGDPAIDRGFRYKPTGRVLGSITQWLTDVDRDGYGLLSIPADPNPFDPAIHPYALDIPGNGIDENGIGGDLPPAPPYRDPEYPPVIFTSRPDVVFVILESFRADAVGAMLNGKSVTPTLDRLRHEGLEASHAYSHNGFTVQSRYHAFTGKILGSGHASSLIDDFNGNGYQTAFFSAQDESFGEDSPVGFARAHVRYDARVDKDKRFTQFATPAS
nr:sulfatase-like hydrolase/transferase [Acidobacteriota bacterium]